MIFFTSQRAKNIFNGMKYLNMSFRKTYAYSLPFQTCYTDQCISFFLFYILVFLETRINDKHRRPQTSAARLARQSKANSLWPPFPLLTEELHHVRTDMRAPPEHSIHPCTNPHLQGLCCIPQSDHPLWERVWIQIQIRVGLKKEKLWEHKCYRTNPARSAANSYQCHSAWQFS